MAIKDRRNKFGNFVHIRGTLLYLWVICNFLPVQVEAETCPSPQAILPCRCSLRGKEMQIWCSHSNLPQIMGAIKALERNVKTVIDELVLENNQLPALPGRFFGTLQIMRLMLRYNGVERVSNGWLNELENSLVEIYIVEPQLRSIPHESLNGMINMIAITIQSDEMKHLPNFSELLSLTYLSVQSTSLMELQAHWFRHLPKVQNMHINGGPNLNRLETGLFDGLISLKNIDLSHNGINWIHLRAFSRLTNMASLKLSYNKISDVGMVGRIVKDLENLKKLRLDHNSVSVVEDGSFVDLPHLTELHLNDNRITDIQYGAFLRVPVLKTIYLQNNHIRHIHPESFLQASGSGVETVYIYNNKIEHIDELRSLLDALPTLKFLDMSNNYITSISYGALRGHGTLEQLHLNNNLLETVERDAFMAMPALRELRIRNNSLSDNLPMPFWNLPGLKGLDLAGNKFRVIDGALLSGLPSLRRLDLSENGLIEIAPNSFIHNHMLETLNISGNELLAIHPATFRHLHHLFEVDANSNQFKEVIPGLPEVVERISLRGNLITALPAPASKTLNLQNLRMLDLSWNLLEYLPKHGFQGTPQLRVLSLSKNRLRALDDTTFLGLKRLELLHLQDNALAHIDERTFLSMPELRNLNLEGNKIETINDNMFSNNSRLEQLNLARNKIYFISPAAFESQRSLEYLDLASNNLSDMSISLSNLISLQDIDLSYNRISKVHADVVSAWQNAVEIRLSNNIIAVLHSATFRNLPKLQYLDLSSNEISSVEPGAIKQLQDLQELVLADNKLVDLKDHVFEDLPNLLASHFQFNTLKYISSESFSNAPSMVFLNLSNNKFHSMENIGLRNMRNLEVLDLSANEVKTVPTMPLRALNWLVELKMDNNDICKIQGSPFETMPRLRVLSMRNNRLRTIKERSFRNLRGNIAVLDVDGNPITCSCEMQWFSVWLQETNFPYPGPKCQDGRLLRSSRIDKSLCSSQQDTNHRTDVIIHSFDNSNSNNLPLLNEHGDIFQRELADELSDECDGFDYAPSERPLAGESEYFYDHYIDYTPANEVNSFSTTQLPPNVQLEPSSQKRKPPISSNINLNNTILNTNYFQKRPVAVVPQTSPFTFFGYPITGLNFGRFFGSGGRSRKYRGEDVLSDMSLNETSATMPATHRSSGHMPSSNGRVRMLQPNNAEFEKYLKYETQSDVPYHDVTARNSHTTSGSLSDENVSNEASKSLFRTTAFREPVNVERGGFRPILPDRIGGFMPVHDPMSRKGIVEATNKPVKASSSSVRHNDTMERHFVPVVTENAPPDHKENKFNRVPTDKAPQHIKPVNEVLETVTAKATETEESDVDPTTEQPTTLSPASLSASDESLYTSKPPAVDAESGIDSELYDDLDIQSVGILKPPPVVQTTTAETILLIPPPEEHMEQFKRHSWVKSTTTLAPSTANSATTTTTTTETPAAAAAVHYTPRPAGGRSTITKVYTPPTLNKYLPTAEEYYRTTTTSKPTMMGYFDALPDKHQAADADKRHYNALERLGDSTSYQLMERADRKDGLDWYYDSFNAIRASSSGYDRSVNNPPVSGSFRPMLYTPLCEMVVFLLLSQNLIFNLV